MRTLILISCFWVLPILAVSLSFVDAFDRACVRAKVETKYTDTFGRTHLLIKVDQRDNHLVRFHPKKDDKVNVCFDTN